MEKCVLTLQQQQQQVCSSIYLSGALSLSVSPIWNADVQKSTIWNTNERMEHTHDKYR